MTTLVFDTPNFGNLPFFFAYDKIITVKNYDKIR